MRGSFEALIRRYERKAYNLVYRMVGNHTDASRVLEYALANAYSAYDELRADEVWLLRSVAESCLSHLRAAKGAFTEPPAVHQALGGVPPEERLLLVLHDVLGYSYDLVGQIAGVEAQAVVHKLHVARRYLRGVVSARTA